MDVKQNKCPPHFQFLECCVLYTVDDVQELSIPEDYGGWLLICTFVCRPTLGAQCCGWDRVTD